MAGHGVAFSAAGALAAPYGPSASSPQVIHVMGLTVTNTTATASAVVVRDGGSTGNVMVSGNIAAQASGVPGTLDVSLHHERVALNGLYVEIDGGAATGVVWVK